MFRREALNKLNSVEELDRLMTVVGSKGWLVLWTVTTLVALIVVWAFFGVIPTTLQGKVILGHEGGNIVVRATTEGIIHTIYVKDGDHVEKNQVLIKLNNQELASKIKNAQQQLTKAEKELEQYQNLHEVETATQKKTYDTVVKNTREALKRLTDEINFLQQELEWKEELLEEGLISITSLYAMKEHINEKISNEEKLLTEILGHEAKLESLMGKGDLWKYEGAVLTAEGNLKALESENSQLTIVAPVSGLILGLPVMLQEQVESGHRMVWLERDIEEGQELLILAYFKGRKGGRILKGMKGHVNIDTVDSKRDGELIVHVRDVRRYPVTYKDVYEEIGNRELVNYLTDNDTISPIHVTFSPKRSDQTKSGYQWTTENGPDYTLNTGSLGTVRLILFEKHPIEYVFPLLRVIEESVDGK